MVREMWESVGTYLETKCLEPRLPKEQRVGKTYLFIPTSTLNFRGGGEPDFVWTAGVRS